MLNKIREINIVGNVDKLREYKKEIESSTASLSLYWGVFICGIWISQQPQIKTLDSTFSNTIMKLTFIVIPGILLFSKLIPTWLKYNNMNYVSDTTTEKAVELNELLGIDKNREDLKFKNYLKNFHKEHPILTLSIVGLIVNQKYFINHYNIILSLFNQIPLLNSFYRNWFSIVPLITLIIGSEYIYYIKNNIIRRMLRVLIFINFPVIFAGISLGLCSLSIYPAISIIHSPMSISYFGTWMADITNYNFFFVLTIPMLIIYMFGNITIEDIDKEINKCMR